MVTRLALFVAATALLLAESVSYTYDSLNRLTRTTYASGTVIAYTYDADGNRTSQIISGGAPTITLSVDKSFFSFTAVANQSGNTPSQTVNITFTGGSPAWTASPSAAWISLSKTSGTGSQALGVTASAAALSAGTYNGTITIGSPGVTGSPQTVAVNLVVSKPSSVQPTADTVTPNTASGANQTFTFKYSSPNGYGYLSDVYALINGSLSASNACFVHYVAAANALYLGNDAGTAVTGPLTPGTAGTLQNSQCIINGTGSSVAGSENTLTLSLMVTAMASFSGTQSVFGYAADVGGLNSGWQPLGTWKSSATAGPTADSVSPATASGVSQTFTFKYSSPNGYGYLSDVYALINGSLSANNACFVHYVAAANALYLGNDAGTAVTGPLTPGAAGTLQNSQCIINGTGSSAAGTANTLTLALVVTAKPAFSAIETIFGYAADSGNLNSGWQTLGTWTVAGLPFSELWDNAPDYTNKWQMFSNSGVTQLTYTSGNLRLQAGPTNPPGGIVLLSRQIFTGDIDYSIQLNHQGYGRTNVGLWSVSTNDWLAYVTLDTDDTNFLAFNSGGISTLGKYVGTPYMNRWIILRMKVTGNQISFYADGVLKEVSQFPQTVGIILF